MFKIFKGKLNKKWAVLVTVVLSIVISQITIIKFANASIVTELLGAVTDVVSAPLFLILGAVVAVLAWVVGQVSTLFVYLLFAIAEYNGFIHEPLVKQGWVVVRDVCNMFFVLAVLIIAFATILKIETYNLKKTLPKLLIMVVLINFSKTICGFVIDFAQVIMLTFVNAFNVDGQFIGHGVLVNALGLQKLFNIWEYAKSIGSATFIEGAAVSNFSVFGSMLFGLILLIIACVVVVIYTLILVFRVVMLWILIILSPLAFLAMAIPAGAKYASQWVSEFTKYVIIGPVMAFFLWLALTLSNNPVTLGIEKGFSAGEGEFQTQLLSQIGGSESMINYLVIICFLLGGLMMAQQAGVAGGSMAGGFVGLVKKLGVGASYKLPIKGADWLQRKASMSKWADKAGIKGFDLAPTRMYKRITEGLADEKRKEIDKMGSASGESMKEGGFRGLISSLSSPDFAKEVLDGPFALRGIRNVFRGGADMHSNELEKASKHDAYANAAQAMTGFTDKGYDDERLEREFKQEDAYKDLKKTVGEEKANEYFSKIKGFSATNIDDETKERREYSQRHRKMAAKYKIPSAAGDKVFWGGIMEAKSKVSENAEEAIAEAFVGAVEKNDWELASGLALKSAEVNGYNTLLAKMGYSSVHAGFTEEKAKELNKTEAGRKHYQQFRGGHDMFRDIFVKKFGMGNERAFSVEDEISETCLAHGHLYGAKTIANKDGRKVQRSAIEQAEATLTEIKKGDAEGLVRKYQKAGFGGHDANGKWRSSDLGQNMMLTYWKTIAKQIEINRWNQSASEEMGKKEEVKKIKKAFDGMVDAVGKENEQVIIEMFGTAKVGDNTKGTIEDFFDRVEQYSKVGGPEFGKIIAAGRAGEKYELKNTETKKEDDDGSADLTKLAEEERKKRDDRFYGRS